MKKLLPNILTSLNLSFGVIAILLAHPLWSPVCILLGSICDVFDGYSARKLDAGSAIGKELDSFADLITFGLAPVYVLQQYFFLPEFTPYLIVIFGTLFAAIRLARFNTMEPSPYFIGLPTPAYGILIVALLITYHDSGSPVWASLFIPLFGAFLMISKVPFPSFKSLKTDEISNLPLYLAVGVFIVLVLLRPWYALLATMMTYIISSLIFAFLRKSS